jgi:hypothetical protein
MTNLYKEALRQQLRFEYKGLRSTEELWQLTVEQLDSVFQLLNAERKTKSEESLLSIKSTEASALDLKIEIIKDIVTTKLADRELAMQSAKAKEQKQKILEALARKKDSALENLSIEELEKMAAEL